MQELTDRQKDKYAWECYLWIVLALGVSLALISCTTAPIEEAKRTPDINQVVLPWSHADWDKELYASIDIKVYDKAKDIGVFCPNYFNLQIEIKKRVIGEFYVELARRESDWKIESESVDVGSVNNKDTWSVGLFQMSVVDQISYNFPMGYGYGTLLQPVPNIKLAVAIMEQNISKYESIQLRRGLAYWAPLMINGKYNQVDGIVAKVKQRVKECI